MAGRTAGHRPRTPANHDWLHRVISDPAEVHHWWGTASTTVPNIVLVCGEVFDAWSVPRELGARALDLLPDDIAPFVPIAVTPAQRWHLFTTAVMPDETPHLPPDHDVLHLGAGQFVPALPSTRGASATTPGSLNNAVAGSHPGHQCSPRSPGPPNSSNNANTAASPANEPPGGNPRRPAGGAQPIQRITPPGRSPSAPPAASGSSC